MTWNPLLLLRNLFNRRYKPYFRHAKKLFVFDMFLILVIAFFAITSLLWFFYVPQPIQDVEIHITAEQKDTTTPLKSGEELTFYIYIKNKATKNIIASPLLQFIPPKGFRTTKLETPTFISEDTKKIQLQDIPPKQEQLIVVKGFFVGSVHKEQIAHATLQFKMEKSIFPIYKADSIRITPESSALETQVNLEKNLIRGTHSPLSVTLRNTSESDMENISLDLSAYKNILKNIQTNVGSIGKEFIWDIDTLAAGQNIQLTAELDNSNISEDTLSFSITPVIHFQNENFLQDTEEQERAIITPNIFGFSTWSNLFGSPGKEISLSIKLENQGNVSISDMDIELLLPENIVNTQKFRTRYNTSQEDGLQVIHLNKDLAPGEILTLDPLDIPIVSKPSGGTQLNIKPVLRLRAKIEGVSQAYTKNISIQPLPISSALTLEPSIQYYTEGLDQIGRGPLPLKKGMPTKFWVLLNIGNTANELSNLKLQGSLGSSVEFTKNTSVSNGPNLSLSNKDFSWIFSQLPPYDYTRIGFEVEVVPQKDNQLPEILKNMNITAEDTYTHEMLNVSFEKFGTKIFDYNKNTQQYLQ